MPRAEALSLIAACHSAACAPPPAGSGGSTKGAGGALARAKARITAPASNVDRTGRNSFDKYHPYKGPKPVTPATKKRPSGPPEDVTPVPAVGRATIGSQKRAPKPVARPQAARPGVRAKLAQAWRAVRQDTSGPVEDVTPAPEIRRTDTNVPVTARPKLKITRVAPAGASAKLSRAAAVAGVRSKGAFSNPANHSDSGYPYPDRRNPKPKSRMVTRAEARRSRGGKDIPVAASA